MTLSLFLTISFSFLGLVAYFCALEDQWHSHDQINRALQRKDHLL
jgi:hypothetical protein